jgi:integrase
MFSHPKPHESPPMPRTRLTANKIVRHARPDGSVVVYQYDRATGARLPGGEPTAAAPAPAGGRPSAKADPARYQRITLATAGTDPTLGELVRAWRYSTHFAELAPATQSNYQTVMRHPAVAPLLEVPCRAITQRALRNLRDGIAEAGRAAKGKPAKPMANLMLNVLGACFAWGLENFDLEVNPVQGMKRLAVDDSGHLPWSDEAVAAWLEHAPEWSRRLIQLGLWTALRAADLIGLRWDAWDGAAFHVVPAKTRRSSKVSLYIPLSAEANATLAAWKAEAESLTILTQSQGRPWRNSNYLALQLARARAAHGLPPGTTHGLRVTAATRLIEAGVPSRDVMALTGHTKEDTFARYVRQADQRQRAERAAAAWEKVTPLRRHG